MTTIVSGHHEGGESRCLEVTAAGQPAVDAAQPGQPDLYTRHGGQTPLTHPGSVSVDEDVTARSSAKPIAADVR